MESNYINGSLLDILLAVQPDSLQSKNSAIAARKFFNFMRYFLLG